LVELKQSPSWPWQSGSSLRLHRNASVAHWRISIRFSDGFERKSSGRMSSPSTDWPFRLSMHFCWKCCETFFTSWHFHSGKIS
jgi:hypothetical protein